jgi:hypothetical protein
MAFVGLCVVGIVLMLEARYRRYTPPQEPRPIEEAVGKRMDLPGVSWNSAPVSVVLQLSPTCHFCEESMPFYRKLAADRNGKGQLVPLVVAAEGSGKAMEAELVQNRIPASKIVVIGSALFGSTATPALYLVDSNGIVRNRFMGKLDSSAEEEVMSSIQRFRL